MNIKIEPGANVQITDKPIINVYGDMVQHKEVHIHPEGATTKKPRKEYNPLRDEEVDMKGPHNASELLCGESFADRVKAIMCKAATKNGQKIETSAKGHAGAYIYYIDADAFCRAMDDMVNLYGQKLKEFLGGTMNCVQVTKVCCFIGNVIRMNIINDTHLQTVDMLFAFEDYYDNLQTVQAKLGDKKTTSDQNVLLGTFMGLLKKHKA